MGASPGMTAMLFDHQRDLLDVDLLDHSGQLVGKGRKPWPHRGQRSRRWSKGVVDRYRAGTARSCLG